MEVKKTNYIYHGVPNEISTDELLPLFDLKEVLPDVYAHQIKKYDDHPKRKELPNKNIPRLNCKRGEVIHCSSIHPSLVFQALKSIFPDGNRSVKFFKIPILTVSHLKMAFFDMNRPDYEFGLENDPETAFDLIDSATYREIDKVPNEAYSSFQEWKDRGEPGAPAWGKIPHVFVQGRIPIQGLEIIDWRDPI